MFGVCKIGRIPSKNRYTQKMNYRIALFEVAWSKLRQFPPPPTLKRCDTHQRVYDVLQEILPPDNLIRQTSKPEPLDMAAGLPGTSQQKNGDCM
jgi:hypothetical protein